MSDTVSDNFYHIDRAYAKRVAKKVLQWHIPVGKVSRPLLSALHWIHVATRAAVGWSLRFIWYEPLFRSQCKMIGERFCMEQLPYLVGRGEIVIGDDVQLSGKPSILFSSRHSHSPRLSIGTGSFLGHDCALTIGKQVRIGNHCLIAGGVRITDFDGHPLDADGRRTGGFAADAFQPVIIGDDVWIGHGAIILKGVRIGDRSVIGARAVVTRDVPSDTVVAGNPARIIKSLSPAISKSA
jgi:acetyltransferase-like isoleucine patch superfamily enzyme